MAEMAFENGSINFEGLMTLTLDRVILHTVMHHSLTSTHVPNFTEIEKTFCGRTDVRTYVRDGRTYETGFIRSTLQRVCLIISAVTFLRSRLKQLFLKLSLESKLQFCITKPTILFHAL